MKNDLLKTYRQAYKAVEKAEAELEALKAQVVATMAQEGLDRIKNRYGLFSITKRAQWVYSDSYVANALKVKQQKETEEKTGVAQKVGETVSLRFIA